MASGRIGSSLRTPAAALVLVALVAVATRFYNLPGRSLWLDEIHTAELYAQLPSGVDVMSTVAGRINQAPLFFLFTWLLGHIGEDEVILRLPSAVFGTLCVVAVFVLARRLFGVRVALFAALLLTFLPFAVWLSQEARPYALLMLMTTLQMYYAYRATTEGRWPFWIGLAAATALNLYTHYFAFVVTGAMALYVGAFILRDALRSAHARAIVAAGGAIAIVAGVTALRGRNLVKSGAHELEHLAANPFWSSLAGWALVAVAVVAVGGVYWFWRRPRPGAMEWAAGGALVFVAIALAALAVVLPHRDGYLPSVLASAIVLAGAAVVAAGAGLLVRALSPVQGAAARLEGAMGAGVLAAASYAPWLSALHLFIFRSDQGIGRLPPNHLSVTDALTLLARLDLWGLVLALCAAGLVTLAVWSFKGRAAEAGLVIAWVAGSAAVLGAALGARATEVEPRYLMFVVPGAAIAVACGVEGIGSAAAWLAHRVIPSWRRGAVLAPVAVTALAAALLAVQVIPALAVSYRTPKDDYRAVVQHVTAVSPPGSFIMALGTNSWWATDCMNYYVSELHSDVQAIDSRRLTGENAASLMSSSGKVYGVLAFPSADEVSSAAGVGGQVTSEFVDVTGDLHVVRSTDGGAAPIDQAATLLQWDVAQHQSDLTSALKALELVQGKAGVGPNLVTAPGDRSWSLSAGVTIGGDVLTMSPTPARPEASATFTMAFTPGNDVIVRFSCRNTSLAGTQGVYANPLDASNNVLATEPEGGTLDCTNGNGSSRQSFFAFTTPPGTTAVQVVLRVEGVGVAEFGVPELRLLTQGS